MARTSRKNRRKRHRILGLVAAAAVAVVVALVVVIVVVIVRRPDTPPSAVPPTAVPPSTTRAGARKPRPEFQDASCPDVQALIDPRHLGVVAHRRPAQPGAVPVVTAAERLTPLRQQFGTDRLEVYTVPYTAQFHNPFSADKQMSYNESRAEGTRRRGDRRMTDMNEPCPLTSYVLVGLLAGRGDCRRHRQRHRQRPRSGGPGPGARRHVDRRRSPPDRRRPGRRAQPPRAGRRDHAARGADALGLRSGDDGPAPGRVRRAQRPHLSRSVRRAT